MESRLGLLTMKKFKSEKLRPDYGFWIGPASNARGVDPGTSFSYFKINSESTTSRGHGLGKDSTPLEWGTPETVPIQQPSKADLAAFDKEFARTGYPLNIRYRSTLGYWDRRSRELHATNPAFGDVVMRELQVIEYEGHRRWCDYSVIKVHPNRAGQRNYIARAGVSSSFQFYFTRDKDGVYIIAVGEANPAMPVRKTGRSTGHTEGKIELAYSFANIEDKRGNGALWRNGQTLPSRIQGTVGPPSLIPLARLLDSCSRVVSASQWS